MSGLCRAGRSIQEGSLYVLLFLLPFSISAVEVTFGTMLFGWLLCQWGACAETGLLWRRPTLRPLAWAVVVFLGVCALSIVGSRYRTESLHGFVGKWLQYLIFFMLVVDLGARPGVVARAAAVMAVSALLVVGEGFSQEVLGRGLLRGYPLMVYGRMTGPYKNPIDLATYLMVTSPFLLTYAVTQRAWWRRFVWGVLVLMIAALGRTVALGAWISLGIAVFLVLIPRRTAVRRYALFLTALAVLAGGWCLHRPGMTRTVLTPSDIGTTDRVVMWQAAVGMIKDRPLLGHGINTFMANYLTYWVGGERQPRYAHNCYLQMAAETGALGLVAFLALLWGMGVQVRRGVRTTTSRERFLLLGLATGLLAFVIHAAVDTDFYSLRQAALFWVLAGCAVGVSDQVLHGRSEHMPA